MVATLYDVRVGTFGFKDYEVNLSTRPEKAVGSDEIWERAELALRDSLKRKNWDYIVDDGGGAFYGPKIDIKILDAIGRKWQCSTIQLDFNLPDRFDLSYIDQNNEKQRPIMIHRAIFGSLERFRNQPANPNHLIIREMPLGVVGRSKRMTHERQTSYDPQQYPSPAPVGYERALSGVFASRTRHEPTAGRSADHTKPNNTHQRQLTSPLGLPPASPW